MDERRHPIEILSALSSRKRFKIFEVVAEKGPASFSEILRALTPHFEMQASDLAYHLSVLKRSFLIMSTEDGRYKLTDVGEKAYENLSNLVKLSRIIEEPIYVRSSRMRIEKFNRNKIVSSLVRETRISRKTAEEIALKVENILRSSNVHYVTAPLIRELVNSLLIASNLENARFLYTRIGMPVYDVSQILRRESPSKVREMICGRTIREYTLLRIFPRQISDAHLSSLIHVHEIEYFPLKAVATPILINLESGMNAKFIDHLVRSMLLAGEYSSSLLIDVSPLSDLFANYKTDNVENLLKLLEITSISLRNLAVKSITLNANLGISFNVIINIFLSLKSNLTTFIVFKSRYESVEYFLSEQILHLLSNKVGFDNVMFVRPRIEHEVFSGSVACIDPNLFDAIASCVFIDMYNVFKKVQDEDKMFEEIHEILKKLERVFNEKEKFLKRVIPRENSHPKFLHMIIPVSIRVLVKHVSGSPHIEYDHRSFYSARRIVENLESTIKDVFGKDSNVQLAQFNDPEMFERMMKGRKLSTLDVAPYYGPVDISAHYPIRRILSLNSFYKGGSILKLCLKRVKFIPRVLNRILPKSFSLVSLTRNSVFPSKDH